MVAAGRAGRAGISTGKGRGAGPGGEGGERKVAAAQGAGPFSLRDARTCVLSPSPLPVHRNLCTGDFPDYKRLLHNLTQEITAINSRFHILL